MPAKMQNFFTIASIVLTTICQNAVPAEILPPTTTEAAKGKGKDAAMGKDDAADTESKFTALTNDYWKWRLGEEPEMATRNGNYKYNDKLESFKYSVYTERVEQARRFLGNLTEVDRAKLPPKQQISFDVFKNTLETYIDGYKWKDYGNINPFNFMEGFLKNPEGYIINIPFDTHGDFLNYVRRVELLSQQIDEKLELSRMAVDLGHTYHNVSINRISKQLDKLIVGNASNFIMYKPFNDFAAKVLADDIANIRSYINQRLKRAIGILVDKLIELKAFISQNYLPHTRKGLGVSHLPKGSDYYKACLKWHTSLDITPEEVHQKGLDEVDRIKKEIEKVMRRLKFPKGTTIREAFSTMASDSKFFIKDGEATLERFREIIFKRIQPKIPKYFKNIPQLPLIVKNSPSDGVSGQYRSVSEDGTIPGIFYANVRRPEDNPTYAMVSLSLHEALPGHHLAFSYGKTSDLPDFRKYFNYRTHSVPFYFPYFNAYVEGWGLYSEYLGEEMGVYENDNELMGRYSGEMWRACRLVIDTGIHYYNWTRKQAIEYMLNYTANTRAIAEMEVDRYATWPGQACGYKIGEMKIKELRKRAEEILEDQFDIQDFHYVILSNGPVPLDTLENIVNNWTASKQRASEKLGETKCEMTGTCSMPQITPFMVLFFLTLNKGCWE